MHNATVMSHNATVMLQVSIWRWICGFILRDGRWIFTLFIFKVCLNLTSNSPFLDIPPAGWTDWSWWTLCSKSCNSGQRQRYRHCVNPPPRPGGKNCTGEYSITELCNTIRCKGKFKDKISYIGAVMKQHIFHIIFIYFIPRMEISIDCIVIQILLLLNPV